MPGTPPRTPESKKRKLHEGPGYSDATTDDSGYDTDPGSPYDLEQEKRFAEEKKRKRESLRTPPRSNKNPVAPDSAKTVDGGDTYIYIKQGDKSEGNRLSFEDAAAPANARKIYYDAEGKKFIFDSNKQDVVEYNGPGGGKSKRRKSKRTKKQKKSKRRRTRKRRYYR